MSTVRFDLKPLLRAPPLKFRLIPVDKIPENHVKTVDFPLYKSDVLSWSRKYNEDHQWWVEQEQNFNHLFREQDQFGLSTLKDIVRWKFKEFPGRRMLILGMVVENEDSFIREITTSVFTSLETDLSKIKELRRMYGVGLSLASVILTFFNPHEYGILDIHVWRELYGKEPKSLFQSDRNYLVLLSILRKAAKEYKLPVRTLEKALFKKNLDESSRAQKTRVCMN
ncbi:MAG: hypothetical protein H8D67_03305 [Deltaproteobacteria bacterium]|nr:hypothetical protein [Deltaproteobacteria bacterium]